MSAKGAVKVTETDVRVMRETLDAIRTHLASIDRQLKHLPEIQAAVFLQMQEAANNGKFQGVSVNDLWEVAPPAQR